MEVHTHPLPHSFRMNGRVSPVKPIRRKDKNNILIVEAERSSIARMRAKSFSFRILNAIATDVPCARKKVNAESTCRNKIQGTNFNHITASVSKA